MEMHVLQLGPYPPPDGGISRNMLALRDELISQGHCCSIIATSKTSDPVDEPNVYHPRSALALLCLLITVKHDILHLHIGGDITNRVLALALTCTIFGSKQSILTVHSGAWPLTDAARNAAPGSWSGKIFRRFRRLIAVNEKIADVFYRYGVADEKIKVVLPFSLTPPAADVIVPDRLSRFYADHKPVLLAVGGLEKDYDPLQQIAALAYVRKEYPDAGLMIVGDGSMRTEVEATVAKGAHADSIMLAGNVPHEVVLHLIRDADIMLRTTLFDGDAISVREALYLGTPVIATDNGMRPKGVRLILNNDRNALVREILAVTGESKPERPPLTPLNSNILEVLEIYKDLLQPNQ